MKSFCKNVWTENDLRCFLCDNIFLKSFHVVMGKSVSLLHSSTCGYTTGCLGLLKVCTSQIFCFCVLECLCAWKAAHMYVPASEHGRSNYGLLCWCRAKCTAGGLNCLQAASSTNLSFRPTLYLSSWILIHTSKIVQRPNGRESLAKQAEWDLDPFYGARHKHEEHVTHCCVRMTDPVARLIKYFAQ